MIRLQPKYPKVSSAKQILFNLQDDILCSCCTAPVLLSLSSLLSPSSPSPPSATYGPKRSVNLEVFVAPANTDFSCYRKLFRHLLCFIFPSQLRTSLICQLWRSRTETSMFCFTGRIQRKEEAEGRVSSGGWCLSEKLKERDHAGLDSETESFFLQLFRVLHESTRSSGSRGIMS